ncbi:MAG: helix-turn-helix domain-containing protein [Acidimicrobiales bacterium]|nr:helix-turn-helix domain-containing protein [Acidimicrobiales bacterium]
MPDIQQQARALGDPTRHGIFRYLADAERPVGVAELTAHFGLNHNAIRQHLAKLDDAGLVVRSVARHDGPGRPPLVFEVDPTAGSRWDVTGPYERLARWLAEIIRTGDSPREVGRRAGASQVLVGTEAPDGLGELVDQMTRQGFDPTLDDRPGGLDVVLQSCPYESTALADPDTICNLHLGFAEGVAERVGGIAIGGLHPHDPRQARCRLRVRTGSEEAGR